MAEPFSVHCCQNRWFISPSSLLPTLCTAAPLCAHAAAHLALGELTLPQVKLCGFFFFFFLGEFSGGLMRRTGLWKKSQWSAMAGARQEKWDWLLVWRQADDGCRQRLFHVPSLLWMRAMRRGGLLLGPLMPLIPCWSSHPVLQPGCSTWAWLLCWPFLVHYLHPLVLEGPFQMGYWALQTASKHLPSWVAFTQRPCWNLLWSNFHLFSLTVFSPSTVIFQGHLQKSSMWSCLF